jgi:hypothetical protein
MTDKKQNCSNCGIEVGYFGRYPKYICGVCVEKITDKEGSSLAFYNTDFPGVGCQGYYIDVNPIEKYKSNICFIGNQEFFAEEGRFGGIVIQKKKINNNEHKQNRIHKRRQVFARKIQKNSRAVAKIIILQEGFNTPTVP